MKKIRGEIRKGRENGDASEAADGPLVSISIIFHGFNL